MDSTEIIKAMETMTDAQVKLIQDSAYNILKIREDAIKTEAIQNFKKAFITLRDLDISVFIEYNDEENIRIDNVNDFNFWR